MILRQRFQDTHLKNKHLRAVYRYLNAEISQATLAKELGKTRTNTYYYIGRAVHYWVQNDILKWRRGIKGDEDLGGEKEVKRKRKKEK